MAQRSIKFIIHIILGLVAFSALAAELKGVKIVDEIKVGGKSLTLNGLAMRQKTFLHVDVYIGALYLEKKSHDAEAILNSPEEKRVELAFVHTAKLNQVQDAFDEAYEGNCKPDCEALKGPFKKLESMMQELKVGDRLAFDIYPGKVEVWVKGQSVGLIEDSKFPRGLLKTWLGEHPPTEALRAGMLGITN